MWLAAATQGSERQRGVDPRVSFTSRERWVCLDRVAEPGLLRSVYKLFLVGASLLSSRLSNPTTHRHSSGNAFLRGWLLAALVWLALPRASMGQPPMPQCMFQPDANGHVTIPSSMTSIADNAFYACYSLASVR